MPVLCFFLAHRLQALERQEPNSALLLHLQKYQPSLETRYSCALQMLTESRGCTEQQGTAWAKETSLFSTQGGAHYKSELDGAAHPRETF